MLEITLNARGKIHEVRNEIRESGIMGTTTGRCTNKIPLIKWVRNQYGLSLLDAKVMVEYVLNNQTNE